MLKIVNSELVALGQSFLDDLDDVDWGDGEENPRGVQKPYGPPSSGRISPDNPPPGIVNEQNFEQFEPSDIEEPFQENQQQEPESREDFLQEVPNREELLGIPPNVKEIEYDSVGDLLDDAMERNEIISFDYTNRFGQFAGTRTVEPHYTFIARTTNNEVLVTFDRDKNDIRAFIVGNIHPYGVRYKDVNFEPRQEIMIF